MKLVNAAALSAFLIMTAACSHDPAVTAISSTAIPADEIAKIDAELQQARAEQIDVFAPTNFDKAVSALKDAKKDDKDHEEAKEVLQSVALSRAYLTKAREYAKTAKEALSEGFEARRLAIKEGAMEAFESDFKDADKDLKDVTADIEDNKMSSAAEQRTEILKKYLALELRAIQRSALNDAQGKIKQAKKDGAEDWAPQSLALAEKSVKDTDNYIISNRHDTAKIKSLSAQTLADADKLILINKEARLGTKATGEQAALKLYTEKAKVAQQQGELASAQTEVNRLNEQKAVSADALANSQEFKEKFAKASKMFNKNEAEVYQQGNNLVIRLKGLEFTNAESTLKGSNFPLLAKVKAVIGDMNAESVMIEGHTDSVGSPESNLTLSQARAEAVKSYFESNESAGSSAQYVAKGYGFDKPIATNTTESGRAQNRRVDVQISTPTSTN